MLGLIVVCILPLGRTLQSKAAGLKAFDNADRSRYNKSRKMHGVVAQGIERGTPKP